MIDQPTEQIADYDLLIGMQNRDEASLAQLYDRYSGLVYTLALRIVGDRELAREVLQDTFWRCWEGAGSFDRSRGGVAGWLMGIARNRAIDLLRSRQHQARLREQESLPESGSSFEPREADQSETIVLRHTVKAALDELPTNQRQVIELAYYGGMTQSEIANSLGKPLGTIKTQMRTALERLRGLLHHGAGRGADEGQLD